MPRKRISIFPLFEEIRRVMASLTDEQFGKAIRNALARYYDEEDQEEPDGIVALAAAMMIEQAGRYDSFREQQRENRIKNREKDKPSVTKGNQSTPSTTKANQCKPSASPSPSPSPGPSPNISNICSKAVQLLNNLSGSSFRDTTKSTQKLISARERDGYTLEDIEMVIRHQYDLWGKDANMSKYLRPETLFGNKFEGYLSDARRNRPAAEPGYTLASLNDPWEDAMQRGNDHV